MRRRRAAGAAAVLAGLVLVAGCGGQDADDRPPGTPDDTGVVSDQTGDVSGTVTLYAAASLQAAFTELVARFEQLNPSASVEAPVYDGSSTLVAQLIEGADADVLATADEVTMADLVAAGGTDAEPQVFATNTLVIAVAPGNPLGIDDLDDLAGTDYAVCAPAVPCGAATTELFGLEGVELDAITQEQNVTAVAERVASGEVDAGLVYATDAATRTDELEAVVPSSAGAVVNAYPITTLDGADEAASGFVAFVLSDEGQTVLAEFGFGPPTS